MIPTINQIKELLKDRGEKGPFNLKTRDDFFNYFVENYGLENIPLEWRTTVDEMKDLIYKHPKYNKDSLAKKKKDELHKIYKDLVEHPQKKTAPPSAKAKPKKTIADYKAELEKLGYKGKKDGVPRHIAEIAAFYEKVKDNPKQTAQIRLPTKPETPQSDAVADYKVEVHKILGDGNCFYSAIAVALGPPITCHDVRARMASCLTTEIFKRYQLLGEEKTFEQYKQYISSTEVYVTDNDVVMLFPLAFPTIGLVIIKNDDSFVCQEPLQNKLYYCFLKLTDSSTGPEPGLGHYDVFKVNDRMLTAYPDFPESVKTRLETQCRTIKIGRYAHPLLKDTTIRYKVKFFSFDDNMQDISKFLFAEEYSTFDQMTKAHPEADVDVVEHDKCIKRVQSRESEGSYFVLFKSIAGISHYDGLEFESTLESSPDTLISRIKSALYADAGSNTIPFQFEHSWFDSALSFAECIKLATGISNPPPTVEDFSREHPYFGLIICTTVFADPSNAKYSVRMVDTPREKLYYIVLLEKSGEYRMLMNSQSQLISAPEQVGADIVQHLKLDVTKPYSDENVRKFLDVSDYAIRYSPAFTSNLEDAVPDETKNVVIYDVRTMEWSCKPGQPGAKTVCLIRCPPDHYDMIDVKNKAKLENLCRQIRSVPEIPELPSEPRIVQKPRVVVPKVVSKRPVQHVHSHALVPPDAPPATPALVSEPPGIAAKPPSSITTPPLPGIAAKTLPPGIAAKTPPSIERFYDRKSITKYLDDLVSVSGTHLLIKTLFG